MANRALQQYTKALTIERAIEAARSGEVQSIRNGNWQGDIAAMIIEICKAHGRDFPIDVANIVAEGILSDPVLAGLNLLDLKIFKRKAVMGEFGTDYIAPAKIAEWMKKYADERSEIVRKEGEAEHERNKIEARKPLHPEVLKELRAMFPKKKNGESEEEFRKFKARYTAKKLRDNQDED